jgi:predicted O-methyltransferase YrrM
MLLKQIINYSLSLIGLKLVKLQTLNEIIRQRDSTLKPMSRYGNNPSSKIYNLEETYDFNKHNGFVDGENIDYCCVELEVARLWYSIIRLLRSCKVLETGVYKGYSTAWIATAVKENAANLGKDGHVVAIDPWDIPHLWDDSELESIITWVKKKSQDAFSDIANEKFDLLIIDSEHTYNTCMWELKNLEKLLIPGGYILMHDSIMYDGVGAAVMELYNNPRFEVVTLDSPRITSWNKLTPGVTIVRKIMDGDPELSFDNEKASWPEKPPVFGESYIRKMIRENYIKKWVRVNR